MKLLLLLKLSLLITSINGYPTSLGGLSVLDATASDLQDALNAGSLFSVDLIDAYLSRIEANNEQGNCPLD